MQHTEQNTDDKFADLLEASEAFDDDVRKLASARRARNAASSPQHFALRRSSMDSVNAFCWR
jgi:hypothetical protein